MNAIVLREDEALNPLEYGILQECESRIEKGLATFIEVGTALLEIRDQRLYREQYRTFEEYCRERWELKQSRAYQLMDSAKIIENLSSTIVELPRTESQARPLAKLEPEQQRTAMVIPDLDSLPNITDARLPVVYERATQALAECTRIDECQEWANKAEALASYARQSHDDTLRKMADRIQARAIRRCGDLLKQIEPGKTGPKPELQDVTVLQLNRTEAATHAGLSERQRKAALRVANIPQVEFEEAVESENPPTITRLAEQGKVTKPQPLHDLEGIDPKLYPRATELQGNLRRLAEFCSQHDPVAIAGAFKSHEKPSLKQFISTIDSWLDRFVVDL